MYYVCCICESESAIALVIGKWSEVKYYSIIIVTATTGFNLFIIIPIMLLLLREPDQTLAKYY
jgi:hypothetical protein